MIQAQLLEQLKIQAAATVELARNPNLQATAARTILIYYIEYVQLGLQIALKTIAAYGQLPKTPLVDELKGLFEDLRILKNTL